MKYVKNTTDTPRRVDNGKGLLVRVPPGAVVAFPNDADTDDIDGLETSNEKEFAAGASAGNPTTEETRDQKRSAIAADAATRANMVNVVVPLQEVIGDSDAPFGPDNGTITTKQAVAAGGPRDKAAFADHENIESKKDGLSPIEVKQAEAKKKANDLALKLQKDEKAATTSAKPTTAPR